MRRFSDRSGQRGSGTLEALIAVFLSLVISTGTVQVAARIAKGQYELRVETIAVSQLRTMLALEGASLCGTTGKSLTMPDGRTIPLDAFSCVSTPKLTVQPSLNDSTAPVSLQVDAVPSVVAKVSLWNLGVKEEGLVPQIQVGTRL
jgi:hypothetical protein